LFLFFCLLPLRSLFLFFVPSSGKEEELSCDADDEFLFVSK
jgi:hypothetical protein